MDDPIYSYFHENLATVSKEELLKALQGTFKVPITGGRHALSGCLLLKAETKEVWTSSRISIIRNKTLDFTATARGPGALQKYDVHLFPVVRFTVRGVEAESMEEACKKADELLSDEAIKSAMCWWF